MHIVNKTFEYHWWCPVNFFRVKKCLHLRECIDSGKGRSLGELCLRLLVLLAYPSDLLLHGTWLQLGLCGDGRKRSPLVTGSLDPNTLSSLLPTMTHLYLHYYFVWFFYKHFVRTFVAIEYMKEVRV